MEVHVEEESVISSHLSVAFSDYLCAHLMGSTTFVLRKLEDLSLISSSKMVETPTQITFSKSGLFVAHVLKKSCEIVILSTSTRNEEINVIG